MHRDCQTEMLDQHSLVAARKKPAVRKVWTAGSTTILTAVDPTTAASGHLVPSASAPGSTRKHMTQTVSVHFAQSIRLALMMTPVDVTKASKVLTHTNGDVIPYFGTCRKVFCPYEQQKWPHCSCPQYATGSIDWNTADSSYNNRCIVAACPANSRSTEPGYYPCWCNPGFAGALRWTGQAWHGTCSKEECPAWSTGWPNCRCVPYAIWTAHGCELNECPSGSSSSHPGFEPCACNAGLQPGPQGFKLISGSYKGSCERMDKDFDSLLLADYERQEIACQRCPSPWTPYYALQRGQLGCWHEAPRDSDAYSLCPKAAQRGTHAACDVCASPLFPYIAQEEGGYRDCIFSTKKLKCNCYPKLQASKTMFKCDKLSDEEMATRACKMCPSPFYPVWAARNGKGQCFPPSTSEEGHECPTAFMRGQEQACRSCSKPLYPVLALATMKPQLEEGETLASFECWTAAPAAMHFVCNKFSPEMLNANACQKCPDYWQRFFLAGKCKELASHGSIECKWSPEKKRQVACTSCKQKEFPYFVKRQDGSWNCYSQQHLNSDHYACSNEQFMKCEAPFLSVFAGGKSTAGCTSKTSGEQHSQQENYASGQTIRRQQDFCAVCEDAFRLAQVISPNMPTEQFRKAFLKASKALHPDRLLNDPQRETKEATFKVVNECYNGVGVDSNTYLDCCKPGSKLHCKI